MESATRSKTAPYVIAAFGLLIIIYLPVISGLVREWYTDGNYSHGFLVPAISAVLILLRHGKFSEIIEPPGTSLTLKKVLIAAVVVTIGLSFIVEFDIAAIIVLNAAGWFILGRAFVYQAHRRKFAGWIDPAGDYTGLILVALGLVLFVLANAAAEYFTLRLSLIVTLAGMVWLLFGRRFTSDIWFELAFLIFMIPLPYVIYYAATFPMQLFATKVTVAILHLIGMSAVQQGNIIHLPGYSLEVGLRSLISLLALGAVYARLTQKGIPRQLILFISTIPIAIAANIFRVTFTAVGAYAVSRELAEDFLHELSGMMVFVVAFIMLFIFGAILKIGSKKK